MVEESFLTATLAALALLPLLGILLRKFPDISISGATAIQQHLTLVVGLCGGALAARDGRLLALSTLPALLRGRARRAADILGAAVAATIASLLGLAAWQLVLSEQEGGKILAYGLPVWVVQLIMPLGFLAIALRLIGRSAPTWSGRAITLALTAGLITLGLHPPLPAAQLVGPGLLLLVAAVILGAPIFVMLGGAALVLFWGAEVPIASLSLTHYSMVTNPTLPTIPLFTMAGYFLAEGGASRRLVRVFQALLGGQRAGPALVTVLLCAFFTSFTGASGVTILALGSLLVPVLTSAGYGQRGAIGLVTGSGGLGLLLPPSLPLILFAIVAGTTSAPGGVTIEKMFLGGVGPALLLVGLMVGLGVRLGPDQAPVRQVSPPGEAWRAINDAKWELLLPVVALVALFGGFATPVEAAAVTAFYAFVIEAFVYRDLRRPADLRRVLTECGVLVGGVLLIMGVALGFTNYLIDEQVPARIVDWVTGAVDNKYVFLLAFNLCLLAVGCIMDMYSAIVVVVPLLLPLGQAYGIDPIHLGIIFLANLELGLLTPSAGINIFLSAYRFNQPVLQVSRAVLPMQLALLFGVLVITYLPPLTTWLPHWLGR